MIKRSQPATLKHSRVQRLALEPRIVFDGALPVAGVDAMDHNSDHGFVAPPVVAPIQRDTEQTKPSAPAVTHDKSVAPGNDGVSTHEVIFVDASVSGLQALLNQHQQAEVIVLDPYRDGVEQIATALAGFTTALSTSPERMLAALARLRLPVALCYMTTAALRFIPLVVEEVMIVRQARRRRGYRFRLGGALRGEIGLLFPILASSIRRAETLAESVTARGFDPRAPRTFYPPLRMRGWEVSRETPAAIPTGAAGSRTGPSGPPRG